MTVLYGDCNGTDHIRQSLLRSTRGLGTIRALYGIIREYKGIIKGIIRDYTGLSGIIRDYTGIHTGLYGHCKGSVE